MATEDFRRIVESLRVPVALTDPKGAIVFANEAFAEASGRERASLTNASLASVFRPDDQKRIQQNVTRIAQGKAGSAFVDAEMGGEDGDKRWMQLAFQPLGDATVDGVIVVLQDTTAQRQTERELNISAARTLALAEESPVATLIENAQGEVELANDAFCRLLEISSAPQSLSGIPVLEALARSPLLDRDEIARARAESETVALVVASPDAGTVTLERLPLAFEDVPAGAIWWTAAEGAHGESVTHGAAQIALIEKIGMELSVALEGISAIAIRAQQMEFDPALVEHFQRIRVSTETAVAAIGDLVDFSSVSGGGVVLRKEPFALRASLAQLIERLAANSEEHGCTLRIKVEQDVSDDLDGDAERLLLALKNLLDNAFALFPGAEVTLQITPEYMTDTGIQLSFAVVAAGEAARHPAGGVSAEAGMGVAVARFMVTAMGGKLSIAARSGGDALYAFTIEFPVRPSPEQAQRPSYVSLVGLPVLVVSADIEQRLQLTNVLRGFRMLPLEADNASMAIALLERMSQESTPVPLVILSNRLPGQDGFLLAFRIRNTPRYQSTLVMMLATGGKPGDAIACRENGIAAYMRYPISDRQLNEAIMAVTGASADTEETHTLVTRHSLREQRKGATVLLVDSNRDSQILTAHILGRLDCNVVVAKDYAEAISALDQDVYEIVLVDTTIAGLNGTDGGRVLRSHIARDAERTLLVAVTNDHSAAFRDAKAAAGFDSTLVKPFRRDDLVGLLASRRRESAEAH